MGRGRLAELFRACPRRREEVRRGRPPRGGLEAARPGAAGRAGGVGAGAEPGEGRCGGRAEDAMREDCGEEGTGAPGLSVASWTPQLCLLVAPPGPGGRSRGAPHLGAGWGLGRSPPAVPSPDSAAACAAAPCLLPGSRSPQPRVRGACGWGVFLPTQPYVRDRVRPRAPPASARHFAPLLLLMLACGFAVREGLRPGQISTCKECPASELTAGPRKSSVQVWVLSVLIAESKFLRLV